MQTDCMYVPAHFALDDPSDCIDVIERRGVGTLVVASPDGFEATLLPWLVQEDRGDGIRLLAHVARANPMVKLVAAGAPALITFDLVDGYISPSWYPSKHEHHKVVPTWNYVAVHAHGSVATVEDPEWLMALVTELTDRHEADMKKPWSVADAPDDYLDLMVRAIVGLEFTVTRLEGKAKLSQNRSEADRAGVRAGLSAVGDDELWATMSYGVVAGEAAGGV